MNTPDKFMPLKLVRPRLVCVVCNFSHALMLWVCSCVFSPALHAQGMDTIPRDKHYYHYWSAVLLSGTGFVLSGCKRTGEHARDTAGKAIMIRPSVFISYSAENGFNDPAMPGTIDNSGRVIEALGLSADSVYVTDATRYSPAKTYASKKLGIAYTQNELSFMPRLSIASNPYLHAIPWQIVLGYNMPLIGHGGIRLIQDAGDGNRKEVGHAVSLDRPRSIGISATCIHCSEGENQNAR